MQNTNTDAAADASRAEELDVLIIGAGFSGLYMLTRCRELGLNARVYEAGSNVGGTWYWNRYPGARCDSDSYVYCFSERFCPDLLAEWEWNERYPTQPEIERYLQLAAERMDLVRDIQFDTRVESAVYDETANRWRVTLASGKPVISWMFIPAVGALSMPQRPSFPGQDDFQGEIFHSSRWPEGLDWAGKRVAVIGAGATGVQIVPEVAREAAHVYACQRNPYHALPARNQHLDRDDWDEIHNHHAQIWQYARENFGGFPYREFVGDSTTFTAEQRRNIMQERWDKGGFEAIYSGFMDVIANRALSDEYLSFMRSKIHAIVSDPELADRLTPTDPFGGKRPPLEHGYYASFNRDNVTLIDLKDTPIEALTPTGLRTSDDEYDVDIIVLATGFDAYTGAMLAMDIRGREGQALRDAWSAGPSTWAGLATHGFPNMFMLYCGAYNPAIVVNAPTLIEQQGDWIRDCLHHLTETGSDYIEIQAPAEQTFMATHREISSASLIAQTNSWWTGANIEGKAHTVLSWIGGFPVYRQLCDEAAANNYQSFTLHTRRNEETPA